ncbi:hypothetical protein A1F97_09642 [Pyrenophora tritici-repentis]|nr:hypothetical protein Alg215_07693 [Pyrenophora tritici-repentis]KAI1587736.1 hypothetical protein PtrEW13061_007074 [Pyrenophora tritici-repentis]KAI1672689.1 hypothetical protein L13192_03548 [Pyrenophora tritici-repentis]KAI1686726.1 hypothetical protein KJE20_04691 [Pyrenophora tritici-repentis]PZC92912.1 hypothetical protein A1F95_07706 [Pyrenophora tritici-repentis]
MRSAPKNETEAERDAQASSTMDTAEVKEVEHSGVKLYSNADEYINEDDADDIDEYYLDSENEEQHSAEDALRVLRERFEDLQMERDDENNRRKWINSKVIYRTNSVHGGSPLWEMECADYGDEDGNEELEQDTGNEAAGLVLSSPLHFNIDRHRVHAVRSDDTLAGNSSARPSLFSGRTSYTSQSSFQSNRPDSPPDNCSLALEVEKNCATSSHSSSKASITSLQLVVRSDSSKAAISEVISARARPGLSRTVQQGEAVSATTEYQERFVDRYLGIVTDRQAVVEAAQDDEAVVLPDLVDLERGIPLLELGNCVSAASHILTAYDVATGEASGRTASVNSLMRLPRTAQEVTRRCLNAVKKAFKTAWGFVFCNA